jgi:hypothetical protein
VEKGFDRLFNYDRQLTETFEYCNTMKNGGITGQFKMQERELKPPEISITGEKKNSLAHKPSDMQANRNLCLNITNLPVKNTGKKMHNPVLAYLLFLRYLCQMQTTGNTNKCL